MPFWLDDYARMIAGLSSMHRQPRPVADFLKTPDPSAAIVRHDVDRCVDQAVAMAEFEARADVRSSYYFRCDPEGRFPARACERIVSLRHELGYHYEDLARARGNVQRARESFERHLAALRRFGPCLTVSMHGSPLSRHGNQQLFEAGMLSAMHLLGDAVLSMKPYAPVYFTDAGGTWNARTANLRDRLGSMPAGRDPLSMADLAECVGMYPANPMYFNVHPERWALNRRQYVRSYLLDAGAAAVKQIIRTFRK